jgi:hypothetical protein
MVPLTRKKLTAPEFYLGRVVATSGAIQCLSYDDILSALDRHAAGEWGDLDEEDRATNNRALKHGGQLFSRYHTAAGVKFYIITEADRELTTILLPEEY